MKQVCRTLHDSPVLTLLYLDAEDGVRQRRRVQCSAGLITRDLNGFPSLVRPGHSPPYRPLPSPHPAFPPYARFRNFVILPEYIYACSSGEWEVSVAGCDEAKGHMPAWHISWMKGCVCHFFLETMFFCSSWIVDCRSGCHFVLLTYVFYKLHIRTYSHARTHFIILLLLADQICRCFFLLIMVQESSTFFL